MTKKEQYLSACILHSIFLIACFVICQVASAQYQLRIHFVDKDSSFNAQSLKLQTNFTNRARCVEYINTMPALLNIKGYAAASVDSIKHDSSFTTIRLYLGSQQHWVKLQTKNIDKKALDISGFINKDFVNKPVNISQVQQIQQRILNYYENNGYPFAGVFLDSIRLVNDSVFALLNIDTGPLYTVDSIRQFGKASISNRFLQHYLGLPNGSIYSKEKLLQISKRLQELPYLQERQPWNVSLLGTGAVVNLYLQPKRSSQINFLVGFLPANDQTNKLRLTGDVNLNLKNVFSNGETMKLNWQQLQPNSPRLNIGYQQPYIFNSPFGIDFSFDLFKKDSSFLQLNTQLGIQYLLSANQSGKIFFQQQSNFLLSSGVDTNMVKATKQLPPNIDVSSVNIGLDYEWNNLNYKLNPRSGNQINFVGTVGIKNIKKNSDILAISDSTFNYASLYDSIKLRSYQFRIKLSASHFFPLGKQSVLKTSVNTGIYSSQQIFKNELFQIGGYQLLRGFDEESIYATQYGVATAEFRYLAGLNSYLFGFVDLGWVKNKYQSTNFENKFLGTGIGMFFETKLGLLNVSFAVGKRDDVKLDIRQASKIHFGYINYF